jgi:hypothetical protein
LENHRVEGRHDGDGGYEGSDFGVVVGEGRAECTAPDSEEERELELGDLLGEVVAVFVFAAEAPGGDTGCEGKSVTVAIGVLGEGIRDKMYLLGLRSRIHKELLQTIETNHFVLA